MYGAGDIGSALGPGGKVARTARTERAVDILRESVVGIVGLATAISSGW